MYKKELYLLILVTLAAGCGPEVKSDLPETNLSDGTSSNIQSMQADPLIDRKSNQSEKVWYKNNSDLIILIKETGGGLRPPQFSGWGEKITVSANGSVVKSIRDNGESAWQETLIATIAPHDISNLITTVSDLMAGELIFPEVEGCTCVPVTSYAARNQLGELVEFARSANCLMGILESFPQAERLRLLLDSFENP